MINHQNQHSKYEIHPRQIIFNIFLDQSKYSAIKDQLLESNYKIVDYLRHSVR